MQTLAHCKDPSTQNTAVCKLIGVYMETPAYTDNAKVGHIAEAPLDQVPLFINPSSDIGNWQDYNTQNTMGQVPTHALLIS